MATVIRFARHGTKKRPYYRIVVQDQRSPRDGRFIEHIGAFEPQKAENSLVLEQDRLAYWVGTGAQLSDSVRTCLKNHTPGKNPSQKPRPVAATATPAT